MDIEKELIEELAKNGSEKAKELFLKMQEKRFKATKRFIELFDFNVFPNDKEVKEWFEENIDGDSASSAIYKFRLFLKERLKAKKNG